MEEELKRFGKAIDELIAKNNLSRTQMRDFFAEILENEQPELHQGAFLAALAAKNPTPAEIAGAWEAIYELDTVRTVPVTAQPVVENSGTGMDQFKTFNISTAAAIVAAAGAVPLARHGARAITSRCGTVDICEALGVDVECSADVVRNSIEQAGIGLFNGMSAEVHPRALFRILSQIRFGSILNIAASLANPANPRYAARGVYAARMLQPTIETMREIGFSRALVFHGETAQGGIDELSPAGNSVVAELRPDGEVIKYTLTPKDLGVRDSDNPADIAAGNDPHQEALRLLRILTGQDTGILREAVCLNAAPIFYVAGMAENMREGVENARKIVSSGKALNKLTDWVHTQNRAPDAGRKRLQALMSEL